jgi:hypothetical protein
MAPRSSKTPEAMLLRRAEWLRETRGRRRPLEVAVRRTITPCSGSHSDGDGPSFGVVLSIRRKNRMNDERQLIFFPQYFIYKQKNKWMISPFIHPLLVECVSLFKKKTLGIRELEKNLFLLLKNSKKGIGKLAFIYLLGKRRLDS